MKAVAIPYVIALILGLIVIGLVGYWAIAQSGKTIDVSSNVECDGFCTMWKESGFSSKPSQIDKCPRYSGKDGPVNCATRLGCRFAGSGAQCNSGEKDLGLIESVGGRRLCCKS